MPSPLTETVDAMSPPGAVTSAEMYDGSTVLPGAVGRRTTAAVMRVRQHPVVETTMLPTRKDVTSTA